LDHLRAELEIRGLWKCAKKLPNLDKKCYEEVKRIVERCEEDCFLDPKKVREEFEEVRVKEVSAAQLALASIIIVQAVAIAFMMWKITLLEAQLNKDLVDLKLLYAKLTSAVNSLESRVNSDLSSVKAEINYLKELVEALKYVIYLEGK